MPARLFCGQLTGRDAGAPREQRSDGLCSELQKVIKLQQREPAKPDGGLIGQSIGVAQMLFQSRFERRNGLFIEAHEQFFMRYRWQWFAVVDPARHFLGIVRGQRVDAEIAAGRPALAVAEVLDDEEPVRVDEEQPLGSLLGAEGLPRLGAMVAVEDEGVLKGVVTLRQVRRAVRLAT